MEKAFRKTGIDIIGDASWGTHLCQFYETREDLVDILVPYFKAGLENNEFCMWITSEPLKVEDAKAALKKVVKNLDHFIKKGQIEIWDYSEWYTKSGKFDANNVLQGWVEKENQALKRGYDGLRLSGNTFWLEEKDWRNFTDYEEEINRVIGKYRMMAICTYSLAKCGASEVIDVVSNHQFALIRREGKWVIIESSEHKRADQKIRNLAKFPSENPFPILRLSQGGIVLYANEASRALLQDWRSTVGDYAPPFWRDVAAQALANQSRRTVDVTCGQQVYSFVVTPIQEAGYVNLYGIDITERKRAEEVLRESKEFAENLINSMQDGFAVLDSDGVHIGVNAAFCQMTGFSREELIGVGLPHPYWPPEAYEEIEKSFQKTLRGEFNDLELTFKRKNGERFPVIVSPSWVKDKQGNVISYFATVKDITERKRVEEALQESEERYRTVARLSSDFAYSCVYTGDDGYEVDWITDAFFTLTGYSKAELHEQRCWLFVSHPDDREMATKPLHELKAGESDSSEFRIVTKDGRVLYIVNYMECQADPEARGGLRLFGAVQDITERKRAEEAVRKSEGKYRSLTENVNLGIYRNTVGPEGKFIEANPAIIGMFGYKSKEEFLAINVSDLYQNAEDRKKFNDKMLKEGFIRGEEKWLKKKDGSLFVGSVSAVAVKDERDHVKYYDGIIDDITERKRAELEYKTIVGTAMDGFWIVDAHGRFLDTNDAYCRLIGYSREELLKMKISDIEAKEKPKETVRHIRKIMEAGGDRFETRHRCKDGRVVDLEVSTNYNKESGDKLFVFLRDITQRKQMGEALAKYIGELQQLSKQLITVQEAERLRISQELHDEMGQALTMLRINIASIKESLPPGYAKSIKDRLADADALTKKILAQIHELTLELRPHMLDDLGLVSTVRWYTERLSRRLNIQILFTQKNLKRRLAPEIRTTLFRIIQEALTNVAKHARAKKVRILLAQKQKFIELIIQDDGCGFDQRKIEKRPSRARGIGLFSMKERAALLNGECAIESRPGAGTKVRIRIPWRKAVEKN
jgi:PAS domain S-box-containing protein